MIGPRLPEGWVSPAKKRRRELQNLRKMVDQHATFWHREFMRCRAQKPPCDERVQYCRGKADAYQEVFHSLSLMRGFPWA